MVECTCMEVNLMNRVTRSGSRVILSVWLCVWLGTFLVTTSLEGSSEFQITTDPANQECPAIYGDTVIWRDDRNGNYDIYGYNLSKGEEFRITEDTNHYRNPAIYGNTVIFVEGKTLHGYNLSTQQDSVIADNVFQMSAPAIYGTLVAWIDQGTDLLMLRLLDLTSGESVDISTVSSFRTCVSIYGDTVVWQDEKWDKDIIYGYNVGTQEEFQVCRNLRTYFSFADQENPVVYGDMVIWTEGSEYSIYALNRSTSEHFRIAKSRTQICDYSDVYSLRYGRPVDIFEDIVVWVDCRNGNPDIYGYNIAEDYEFEVTRDPGCQATPAIQGSLVVWADNRNGNWDIYGRNLDSPLAITGYHSKTTPYLQELFYTSIIAAAIAIPLVGVYRIRRDTESLLRSIETMLPSSFAPHDFGRKTSNVVPLASASLSVVTGVLAVYSSGSRGIIVLVFAIGVLIPLYYEYHVRKIPYIRVSRDKILIPEKSKEKPRIIDSKDIEKIVVETWTEIPSKVVLLLSNNEEITIDLHPMCDEDKERFLTALEHLTPRKAFD
jgi:beta propeller repeat protein